MSTGPAVPQFIVVPRTGIQMCRRVPLRHIDLLPEAAKQTIWNAAQKVGVTPVGDESPAAFFRLVKIGASFYVALLIDTQAGGGSMVSNRVPCIVSHGTALLKREQEICNFFVEDYTKPRSVVGTLVIDYGNSGCAAIFCPDDAVPGSAVAGAV